MASRARRLLRRRGRESPVVLGIAAAALALRLHDLGTLPDGLHGDEALTGFEGEHVLRDGWIGLYSPTALGQPTAPFYATALSMRVFGETIFGVRAASAVWGVLAVVALYFLLRSQFGVGVAAVGAALLAVVDWHLHYSRIGVPLAMWPLVVVLTTWLLAKTFETGGWAWSVAAGVAAGLGIYVYNGDSLFLALVGLFVVLVVLRSRGALLPRAAVLVVAATIVVLPLARFAADPRNGYFNHAHAVSVFRQPSWAGLASTGARADFLLHRYVDYWAGLWGHSKVDGIDASGTIPLVPRALLLWAAVGATLMVAHHRRRTTTVLGLLVVVGMPIAAVVTIEGAGRRTYAMAPFLAAFAAVGLVEVGRVLASRARAPRPAALALPALVVGFLGYQSIHGYFVTFRHSETQRWVFAKELTDASRFMNVLPSGAHVYFLSERWSFAYETRKFVAPNVTGEDRSTEFGRPSLAIRPGSKPAVFVLLGRYRSKLGVVRRRYAGTVVPGGNPPGEFVAYVLRPSQASRAGLRRRRRAPESRTEPGRR